MQTIDIRKDGKNISFFVETSASMGVKKITDRVAEDILLVTDEKPVIVEQASEIQETQVVVAATLGESNLVEELNKNGKIDTSLIEGKREVYMMQVVEQPFADNDKVEKALVIIGSEKRGTIYGLFELSEKCGVSALVYYGDVMPEKKQELTLDFTETIVSKEPSVKYRGFFINDEWPAFGNWCNEQFGGVNAKAYNEIFVFLLRMKGNYMWPAMWDSIFSEEGPGLASAELADMYGVVVGLSHHEPMCRAGLEWQKIYKQYGDDNAWSFISNKEAISEFWKDGILRNKDFENVITIGMRGESDSKLLPEDATLEDNIQVVKNAILAQHKILKENMNENLKEIPRMIAIYKEVEDYYYGDDTTEGLKDWDELEDVIFMMCDDNFGNTRGLPQPGDKPHAGGYGMYYHFDYHGGPISYEWQNSSRLVKTWEQMTKTYEHGVRELWIVNVGDVKGNEYPLNYFMSLAYDYDKWGQVNVVEEYEKQWIDMQFRSRLDESQKDKLLTVLKGWTKWAGARRPEAMNPEIYHPVHFNEGRRVWDAVDGLMKLAEELHTEMPEECKVSYEGMIYYPLMATFNNILMNIEAGLNAHYAKMGSLYANSFVPKIADRVKKDIEYVDAYHKINNGKWNHMMDSEHTGFRDWDAYNWTYPTAQTVYPIHRGKITVNFRGQEEYHLGSHWMYNAAKVCDDFTNPNVNEAIIELGSRGDMDFTYEIQCDKDWLTFEPQSGEIQVDKDGYTMIQVTLDRTKLQGKETADIKVVASFKGNGMQTVGHLAMVAGNEAGELDYPKGTFVENQGYVAINAKNFVEKKDTADGSFELIKELGRMEDALRPYPVTKSFIGEKEAPYVRYDFAAKNEGVYEVELYLGSCNPRELGGNVRCQIAINDGEKAVVETTEKDWYTEWRCEEWNDSVMKNVRIIKTKVDVKKGLNSFYFFAGDPGIILERVILHSEDVELPESYLGPQESYQI